MRIGHFQCHCIVGDYAANAAKVIEGLERAAADNVEIVSFPESLLTGHLHTEDMARRHAVAVYGQ